MHPAVQARHRAPKGDDSMSHLDFVMKLLTIGIHTGQFLLVWLQIRHLLKKRKPKQRRRKNKKNRRG